MNSRIREQEWNRIYEKKKNSGYMIVTSNYLVIDMSIAYISTEVTPFSV